MNPKPFFYFIFSFFAVIVGTLTHEFGHYIVGKIYGCGSTIHYSYTTYENCPFEDYSLEFDILSTLGGPLFTLFESVVGIIVLTVFKNSLSFYHRLAWVFIAFFCSRTLLNFMISFTKGLVYNQSIFGIINDEVRLSHYLNLWEGYIPLIAILVSGFITLFVLYRFVYRHYPLNQFLPYSIIGGVLGIYFWLYSIGQYIIP